MKYVHPSKENMQNVKSIDSIVFDISRKGHCQRQTWLDYHAMTWLILSTPY